MTLATKLGGVTIVRASMLPKGTIYVADDVYEMLTQTPEEAQKHHEEQMAYVTKTAAAIHELANKRKDEHRACSQPGCVYPAPWGSMECLLHLKP